MIQILGPFEKNDLPDVATDRLYLRQRTLADAEAIFAFAKLAEVTYPAGFPPVKSLADEVLYLKETYPANLEKEGLPSGYGITIKGSNQVIGSCDFNHRHADDVLEIGYILHPDFWGNGYMPEAVAALIEVGFTLLHLHKVEIRCYSSNQQSRRVAEKLGFTLEATIRGRKDLAGNRCDDLAYGLLRTEWEERRER